MTVCYGLPYSSATTVVFAGRLLICETDWRLLLDDLWNGVCDKAHHKQNTQHLSFMTAQEVGC